MDHSPILSSRTPDAARSEVRKVYASCNAFVSNLEDIFVTYCGKSALFGISILVHLKVSKLSNDCVTGLGGIAW